MFSGIVAGTYQVHSVELSNGIQRLIVDLIGLTRGLEIGASVAINGVCLTAVTIDDAYVSFDVVPATLDQTNLRLLSRGSFVNAERSLNVGDEIGGHLLAGHIADVVKVGMVQQSSIECSITFVVPEAWRRYCHTKGFIALDGVSLTLAEFDHETGIGVVHLIPETLRRTTLCNATKGTLLNFEVDPTTLAVVATVERMLQSMSHSMDETNP